MRRTILSSLVGIVLVINLAGCEPKVKGRPVLYKVSGWVKYKGRPVKGAIVNFDAKVPYHGSRPATGFTDDFGKFQLTTFDTNDGAAEGEMVVSILS